MITGPEIREARKRAGWTQSELAGRVGVVQRTVGGWERGENVPGLAEPRLLAVLRDYLADVEPEPLRSVSDVELVAELARRLARSEQRERGGGDGRDAAPMTSRVDTSWGPPLSAVPDTVPDAVAAHEEEGSIAGEQEESDTP